MYTLVKSRMEELGVDKETAIFIAMDCRKPRRWNALQKWMSEHPRATGSEIADQAEKIAMTVEPTRHGTPKK